jgi:hypothetical protein
MMRFTPVAPQQTKVPKTDVWSLSEISGGVNYEDLEYKLLDNQSPDCKNVWFNNRILGKRPGTVQVNTSTPSEGAVLAMYDRFFNGLIIFARSTKLYKLNPLTGAETQIYSGLTANKGCFKYFNGKLFYINGAQFVYYDGTTCATVASLAYIPIVCINRTPAGVGNMYPSTDDYNRMQSGLINHFNGDGATKAYSLTDMNLDATTVTCTITGVTKVEGTDFTVNRVTGVVTFTVAPATGQNNVFITVYKTQPAYMNPILGCNQMIQFGYRMFFLGNGTNIYYFSDIKGTGVDYIPLNQYNALFSTDGTMQGFGIQNDTLILYKEKSNYGIKYNPDGANPAEMFPVVPINSNVGCDCPNTIQLINDKLVWNTSYLGVHTLVNQLNTSGSTQVYRNSIPIGRNINGNSARSGLLAEPNLQNAVSVICGQKYWLAVNGHVYVWDYGLTPYVDSANIDEAALKLSWWYFEDLPITCFTQDKTELYCGDTNGNIQHFVQYYNDNGVAINAYWKMKINHLGLPNILKNITKIWLSCRTDTATTLGITYFTDNAPGGIIDAQPILIESFDWAQFDWGNFTWGVNNWFGEWRKVPPMKGVQAFSIMFSNDNANEDLNVSDIIVQFIPVKEVRRSI